MKRFSLILSIAAVACAALLSSCNSTQSATAADGKTVEKGEPASIVFINLDKVSEGYDFANDKRSEVEAKVNSISEEVNRRGNKLQKDVNSFQDKIDKGLLTRSTAEAQSQKLQQQQNDFQNYAAQKQQEINEEQAVMMNQIADAIKAFIDKYAAEKGYDLVLTTQGDILPAPVVYGAESLDITQAVIDGLNETYVKEKSKSE